MQRQDLERMSREQLIAEAERLGIPRPRVLTAPELVDEIIGRTSTNDRERQKARGWLGRARDLLAKVVEKGLHLPEAARVLRQEEKSWPAPPPPLPTVTLAEIYAAQGHFERAIAVLDEVLAREPEHREARSLRERFVEQAHRSRSRAGRIETPPPPPVTMGNPEGVPQTPPMRGKAARDERRAAAVAAPEEQPAAPLAEGVREPSQASAEPAEGDREPSEASAELAEGDREPSQASAEAAAPIEEVAVIEESALDEPPLPQRYEVDEVVAIAVDPRTIYLYWEVRATTLAHARAQHPEGALCVRVASVTASWEGPVVDTRDLHVDALYGDRFIRDVQPGSNVRVSLGWKSAAGFEPLAVGAEVTAPRAVPVEAVASRTARWEEEPPAPFAMAPFSAWRAVAMGDPERVPQTPPIAMGGARTPPIAMGHPRTLPIAMGPQGRDAKGDVVAAPVDTGVALWGEPGAREEITETVEVVEASWFLAGGASELSRGGPGRVRSVRVRNVRLVPGAPGPRFGGASELSRGGASELPRG